MTSDVNKSVRAGDTAGAAAATAGLVGQIEKQTALKAAIAASGVETLTLSKRISDVGRELEHVRGQFGSGLGGILGGLPITPGALGIGLGIAGLGELFKLAGEGMERAHKIEVLSGALGVSTGEMREWQKAAAAAGVDEEVFGRNLERLAASIEKAANEQRKLRIETAQMLADQNGIAARGGMSATPPKISSRLIEPSLFEPLPNQGAQIHDDEVAQARVEQQAAKFRQFADMERKLQVEAAKEFTARGQIAPPVLPPDLFALDLRNRMAKDEKIREAFAKEGGDPRAMTMREQLERSKPGFADDPFSKAKIQLIDEASGKLREVRDIVRDTAKAMSQMAETESVLFAKTTMGKGGAEPRFLENFKAQGAAPGGGAFGTPPSKDPDTSSLAEAKKFINAQIAETKDVMFSAEAAIVRAVKGMAGGVEEASKDAVGDVDDIGKAFDQVPAKLAPDVSASIGEIDQMEAKLREVAKVARSTAAAVGAAMGGGGGNPFSDTGEDIQRFAQGGLFSGRPGRDTNLAWMTDGEYVINRDSARRIGLSTLNAMNFGRHLPRYASGGPVGSISSGGHLGTVHLTLDGQTHSLRADRQNFEGIVQYARTRRLAQIAPRPANAT